MEMNFPPEQMINLGEMLKVAEDRKAKLEEGEEIETLAEAKEQSDRLIKSMENFDISDFFVSVGSHKQTIELACAQLMALRLTGQKITLDHQAAVLLMLSVAKGYVEQLIRYTEELTNEESSDL